MSSFSAREDRLIELLAERFERELDEAELAELDSLLAENPEWREDDLELAAAAVDLAFLEPLELPDGLAQSVVLDAQPLFESSAPVISLEQARNAGSKKGAGGWVTWSGWVAAAAAALFALLPWSETPKGPVEPIVATLSQKAAALETRPETLKVAWAGTKDPLAAGASGEVLWSGERQEGYMRFSGLSANDPNESQYQLWIFDAERNEAHPVDGGVFDSDGGEVLVPIDPRVPVGEATLFAITLEKPGGVVVSTRERLVLVAQPG